MSNSVNLSLDVTKTGIQNPLVKVRQGDGGFETLRTTVTANGEPMDLQGWIITFMGTTAGNHKIVDTNVKMVEASNGIFDYTPSKAWGMDVGEFKVAYFKFVKGDGVASSANFRVNVIEAVDLTQEEAQHYISVVDATIAEVNNHLNAVSNNATALGNRINDYNNKLAALQVGGRNLIVRTGELVGKIVGQDGQISSFESSSLTPAIIAVTPGEPFTMHGTNGGDNTFRYAFYDKDGNTVKRSFVGWMSPATTITTPDNAATLRISYPTSSQVKLERGNVATDWTPSLEDVDARYIMKAKQLPAEARDFAVLASDTIKYQGTWYTDGNSIANGPTANWNWNTIEVLGGFGNGAGIIRTAGFGLNQEYITTVNSGKIVGWKKLADDAMVVHKTGNETIAGDKTFTNPIKGQLALEPENLFFNSEFENSGEGWGVVAGAGTFVVGTGGNDVLGHATVVIQLTGGYVKFGNKKLYRTQGNVNYSLSSLVHVGTATGIYFDVDEFDENKTQIKSTPYLLTSSATWNLKTVSFVTQSATRFVQVTYQVNGSSGQKAYVSAPMWNTGTVPLPYVRGSEMQDVSSVITREVSGTNGIAFVFRRTGNYVHVDISGNYTGTNWTSTSNPGQTTELFNVVVPVGFAPDDSEQPVIVEYGSAVGFGRCNYSISSNKMSFTYRGMTGSVTGSKWIVSSVTYTTSDPFPG